MSTITLDGLELWQDGYRFEFRAGGPDDIPEYVGADDDIPGAAGMDPGNWTKRSRMVRLYGQVLGTGADAEAQQQSYRTRMNALVAKMDVNDLVDIVAFAPTFGVSGNWTLSDCRPQRMVAEQTVADLCWIGTLELLCIASPPEWVESGS